MELPRIGVSGVIRRWGDAPRAGVNAAYLHAVVAGGGVPVVLSPIAGPRAAARALDGCDALLLTGGEDIDPAFYGAAPSPRLREVDCERDRFELALFAAARERRMPVLGICRGFQLINVALGGTLFQDLGTDRPGSVEHDPDAARNARTHRVRLAAGSRIAEALGVEDLVTNSFHHQGIDRLAPGLIAGGWSDDGLIEAVEGVAADPWLLAVQWHPEEMYADPQAPERGLFTALAQAARTSR